MDSLKSYGAQGLAFVKANPMSTFGLIVAFILAVLTAVAFLNLRKVPDNNLTDDDKKRMTNSKRAVLGIVVLSVIGLLVAIGNKVYKK
jgi:hypothetical protein